MKHCYCFVLKGFRDLGQSIELSRDVGMRFDQLLFLVWQLARECRAPLHIIFCRAGRPVLQLFHTFSGAAPLLNCNWNQLVQ